MNVNARAVSRMVIGIIAAAVVVVIAAFLPWAEALGGIVSVTGMSGDGQITVVLGGIGILVGLYAWGVLGGGGRHRRKALITEVVLAVITLAIAIIDATNLSVQVGGIDVSGTSGVDLSASIAVGLWLTLIAAIVWLVLSAVATVKVGAPAPPAPPTRADSVDAG